MGGGAIVLCFGDLNHHVFLLPLLRKSGNLSKRSEVLYSECRIRFILIYRFVGLENFIPQSHHHIYSF